MLGNLLGLLCVFGAGFASAVALAAYLLLSFADAQQEAAPAEDPPAGQAVDRPTREEVQGTLDAVAAEAGLDAPSVPEDPAGAGGCPASYGWEDLGGLDAPLSALEDAAVAAPEAAIWTQQLSSSSDQTVAASLDCIASTFEAVHGRCRQRQRAVQRMQRFFAEVAAFERAQAKALGRLQGLAGAPGEPGDVARDWWASYHSALSQLRLDHSALAAEAEALCPRGRELQAHQELIAARLQQEGAQAVKAAREAAAGVAAAEKDLERLSARLRKASDRLKAEDDADGAAAAAAAAAADADAAAASQPPDAQTDGGERRDSTSTSSGSGSGSFAISSIGGAGSSSAFSIAGNGGGSKTREVLSKLTGGGDAQQETRRLGERVREAEDQVLSSRARARGVCSGLAIEVPRLLKSYDALLASDAAEMGALLRGLARAAQRRAGARLAIQERLLVDCTAPPGRGLGAGPAGPASDAPEGDARRGAYATFLKVLARSAESSPTSVRLEGAAAAAEGAEAPDGAVEAPPRARSRLRVRLPMRSEERRAAADRGGGGGGGGGSSAGEEDAAAGPRTPSRGGAFAEEGGGAGTGGQPEECAVDMRSDAMAVLAATLPSALPAALPPALLLGIAPESCVWANALTGRVFRDAAKSGAFRAQLARSLQRMVNRGRVPEFLDELRVSGVAFGAAPPVLRDLRWVPSCELGGGADAEHDAAVDASVMYRGGVRFLVETSMWLNWPRDRYASLPVRVEIELSELSGPMRFGVRRRRSFASFLQEPHMRFDVRSQVGHRASLRDLPKLDSIVVQRIKSAVKRTLIHPRCKTFRLPWPRAWWPEDPAEDEEAAAAPPSPTSPTAPATPATPAAPAAPESAAEEPTGGHADAEQREEPERQRSRRSLYSTGVSLVRRMRMRGRERRGSADGPAVLRDAAQAEATGPGGEAEVAEREGEGDSVLSGTDIAASEEDEGFGDDEEDEGIVSTDEWMEVLVSGRTYEAAARAAAAAAESGRSKGTVADGAPPPPETAAGGPR